MGGDTGRSRGGRSMIGRHCAILAAATLALFAAPAMAETCADGRAKRLATAPFNDPNFFPLSVWIQAPHRAWKLRKAGVNMFIGQWKGPTEQQLQTLKKAGMYVIADQTKPALKPEYRSIMRGWLMHDEPDNSQKLSVGVGYGPPIPPQEVGEEYCKLMQKAGDRPALLPLGMGVAWEGWHGRGMRSGHLEDYPRYAKHGDILTFNIYPTASRIKQIYRRIELIGVGTARMKRWAKDGQKVWAVIGVTAIGDPKRAPSPADIKSQVWMALVHGADGIVYFMTQFVPKFDQAAIFKRPKALAAFTAQNKLIQELAPVLNSPTVRGGVTSSTKDVSVMAKSFGGARYVFAVSKKNQPLRATLTLGKSAKSATRLDRDRKQVPIKGRTIEEDFAPYGVTLLRIE